MFFVLSKALGFLVHPSNAIALILAVGMLLLLTRWRRLAAGCVIAGTALLLTAGYSPLGNVLLLALSERFPAPSLDGRPPDGIIVLGGAIDSEVSDARKALELDASAERVVSMLDLARRFPQARIVYSGGSANLLMSPVAEAPVAAALLEQFGVVRDRIVIDDQSRTTSENAAFVARLIAPHAGERWLLVTSAFHMPRSVAAFRAVGLRVEAHPVDFRTRGWQDARVPFMRLGAGLSRVDVAAHEWAGLFAYWLSGRSPTLLPAPGDP